MREEEEIEGEEEEREGDEIIEEEEGGGGRRLVSLLMLLFRELKKVAGEGIGDISIFDPLLAFFCFLLLFPLDV